MLVCGELEQVPHTTRNLNTPDLPDPQGSQQVGSTSVHNNERQAACAAGVETMTAGRETARAVATTGTEGYDS